MELIPYIEVNGKTYQIKRNRYLQAEFDKMKRELNISNDNAAAIAETRDLTERLEKLAKRRAELEDKYFETFADEDKQLYDRACEAYNALVAKITDKSDTIDGYTQNLVDAGEKLVIRALQLDDKGNEVLTSGEATAIWEQFVDENGKSVAIEFVTYTLNYINGDEETENPFVLKMREKAKATTKVKK